MRAGMPPLAGSHLARPEPSSSSTGSPNTLSVMPGWIGAASGSSAMRSAIQPDRSRAKAAASERRRGDGAVATISRRVRSSRSDTRRARLFTLRVTAVPATSRRSPSAKARPKGLTSLYLSGFGLLGEGGLDGHARERQFAPPDEFAHPRIDLLAEPLAVEDAVVADVRLDVVLLQVVGDAGAERVGGLG